ncbi:MAG: cytochrome c family protein [Pseudomonadota bacterium]|nr:cytochrome c family protein [Pseudomonadota bacterium]
MNDRTNTIAGWVLGAGIVFLGAWLVTGEIFHSERPETLGYPIAGVTGAGGDEEGGEQPIAHFLQAADANRGEAVFRKCTACHTIEQGGANQLGPNLWGRMGAAIASAPGYDFSSALRERSGETWTWENMSAWLASPRNFAQGTKMTFAGLGDPQDRADVMVYMNQYGGSLQIPAAPASPAENASVAADAPAQGDMADPQRVPDEGNVGAGQTGGPAANSAGPGH